jgi:5,5'-dehydrodivanillate O-demethylase
VEELGGLIFAYVGPEPAPLLPRWDFFVDESLVREIGWAVIPCNWLQCIENGVDGTHVPYLHGRFSDYVLEKLGRADLRRHIGGSDATTGWEPHKFGILKTRVPHGSKKKVGNPLLFPYVDRQVDDSMQIRVPMDDTHTYFIWYYTFGAEGQAELGLQEKLPQDPRRVPVYEVPVPLIDESGTVPWDLLDNNSGQDLVMWHSQGEIADRTREHLGRGDRGVILYRQLLEEQIKIVEAGGDPINTFRDPEANRFIDTSVDNAKGFFGHLSGARVNRTLGARKYSGVYREATRRIEGEKALSGPIY